MAAAKEFFCQPYLEPLRFPRPLRSPWHRLSNTDLALRCPSSRWVNRSLLPLFPAKAARVQRRRLTSTPRDKTKKTADDSTRKCGELFFFFLIFDNWGIFGEKRKEKLVNSCIHPFNDTPHARFSPFPSAPVISTRRTKFLAGRRRTVAVDSPFPPSLYFLFLDDFFPSPVFC